MAAKRELRETGVQYALMFPARLKVMVDGSTIFFNEPKEVWDWLELHKRGREDATETDPMIRASTGTKKTIKYRRAQRAQETIRFQTSQRPTRSQAEQGKRLAVKAAGDIGTLKHRVESEGETSDHTVSGTESEAAICGQETLEGVTPRTADDL